MSDFTDKQNEVFKGIFGELKKRRPAFKTDALTMLKMNEENFSTLFLDIDNEVTGDEEDIDLVHKRAIHVKTNMSKMKFYKGDIIQKQVGEYKYSIETVWGRELIGVTQDVYTDGYVLFHRPFTNKLKHFFRTIKKYIK